MILGHHYIQKIINDKHLFIRQLTRIAVASRKCRPADQFNSLSTKTRNALPTGLIILHRTTFPHLEKTSLINCSVQRRSKFPTQLKLRRIGKNVNDSVQLPEQQTLKISNFFEVFFTYRLVLLSFISSLKEKKGSLAGRMCQKFD